MGADQGRVWTREREEIVQAPSLAPLAHYKLCSCSYSHAGSYLSTNSSGRAYTDYHCHTDACGCFEADALLRSLRLKRAGVPVQLPLNCFHLWDRSFPDQAVPGGLPQVEHSGSCGTLPVTRRASPSTEHFRLNGDESLPRVVRLVCK